MLKRLWYALSGLWAAAILANGTTRLTGIQDIDWTMALLPFLAAIVVPRVIRFVLTGSPRPR